MEKLSQRRVIKNPIIAELWGFLSLFCGHINRSRAAGFVPKTNNQER